MSRPGSQVPPPEATRNRGLGGAMNADFPLNAEGAKVTQKTRDAYGKSMQASVCDCCVRFSGTAFAPVPLSRTSDPAQNSRLHPCVETIFMNAPMHREISSGLLDAERALSDVTAQW